MSEILTAKEVCQWRRVGSHAASTEPLVESHELLRARCEQAERERDTLQSSAQFAIDKLRSEWAEASERIAALEAHVREWRKYRSGQHCGDPDCHTCDVMRASLALVPDTGGEP